MVTCMKRLISFALICLILLNFAVHTSAEGEQQTEEIYGVDATPIPENDAKEIWQRIGFKTKVSDIKKNLLPTTHMVSFDVSDSEQVAVAYSSRVIVVYDKNGDEIASFEFIEYGRYCVEWYGENLLLYTIRGDDIFEFTLDGELVNAVKWDPYETDRNRKRNTQILKRTEVTRNENRYKAETPRRLIQADNEYTQIVRIEPSGNRTVVCSVRQTETSMRYIVYIGAAALFIVGIGIAIVVVINSRKKKA